MKHISEKLIPLLKTGSCTPQVSALAKKLHEPGATIHYNLKKLEASGAIRAYKAVFDYKKINEGFTTYVVVHLTTDEYGDPERIGKELAKFSEIESVDICTGDLELLIKVRTKDIDMYYEFVRRVITRKGVAKTTSMNVLKEIKSEFVTH